MEKTQHLPTERPRYGRVCKNCRFYGVLEATTPICRADLPKVLPIMPKEDGSGWVSTIAWPDINPETDWCGKFEQYTDSEGTVQVR